MVFSLRSILSSVLMGVSKRESKSNKLNEYQKSNDKKYYLTSAKNIIGNIFSDEDLISLTSLDKSSFLRKIKDIYNKDVFFSLYKCKYLINEPTLRRS